MISDAGQLMGLEMQTWLRAVVKPCFVDGSCRLLRSHVTALLRAVTKSWETLELQPESESGTPAFGKTIKNEPSKLAGYGLMSTCIDEENDVDGALLLYTRLWKGLLRSCDISSDTRRKSLRTK